MDRIGLQEIQSAYSRISRYINRTPMEFSKMFSEKCGGEVYLKLENQQLTSSFKIRGALSRMIELSPEEIQIGVVTASSGNHAQGVALAAQKLGIHATIFVPTGVSPAKLKKLEQYDVTIMRKGGFDEVEGNAREYALQKGMTYVSPYNDYAVMAGQGTIGLEIIEDLREFDTVVVPVGGGGLIAGIAVTIKSQFPERQVLGVQTPGTSTMYRSLLAGKIIKVEEYETLAEAFLGGVEEGSLTFDVIQDYVDDLHLVAEETVAEAIRILWSEKKQVVEGAGATSAALVVEQSELFKGKRVVVVVSGGNIEESLFHTIVGTKTD